MPYLITGPTAMGRIPGFTNTIFPEESMPNINLVAQLGLIFFLFMVGMEIDIPYLKKHWKIAASVGVGSIIVPFGLGYAVAVGLYRDFIVPHEQDSDHKTSFGVFGLFIGIAISVTALPVLARILTELGLIRETSGIVVLAAGVSNDIVAWILLALVISLAQAGDPIDTLYIILVTIGWALFLIVAIRPLIKYILKKSGGLEKGPSEFDVTWIILAVFVSSFFTEIIGVHAIFGAFLVGAIIPRDNSFPAKLIAKIEDVINTIFIPIYFAISGFNVDFTYLNDGITWGYTILVIVVAFIGKIVGAGVPARLLGLDTKNSVETGILMSCKGLVELVVLNIGLETNILTPKIFSMFVLMAIVNTFVTTPLTLWWRHLAAKHEEKKKKADESISDDEDDKEEKSLQRIKRGANFKIPKIVVAFDNVEILPANMILIQLLGSPQHFEKIKDANVDEEEDLKNRNSVSDGVIPLVSLSSSKTEFGRGIASSSTTNNLFVSALHLVDLTDRTADLIQGMAGDFISGSDDPVMKVLGTFANIHHIPFEGQMSIAPLADRVRLILSLSYNTNDLILVSWDDPKRALIGNDSLLYRPSSDFSLREGLPNLFSKVALLASLYKSAQSHVCTFIDRGFATMNSEYSDPFHVRNVVIPFFGGDDDWLAFGMGVYLAKNQNIKVKVLVTSSIDARESVETKDESSSSPNLQEGGSDNESNSDSSSDSARNSTVLNSVLEVYNMLPSEIKANFTITKFNIKSKAPTLSTDFYIQEIKLYGLEPEDLLIIGRSAPNTDNDLGESLNHLSTAPSMILQRPISGSARTPTVIPENNTFDESFAEHNANVKLKFILFGAVTTDLITSNQLKCSFMVCSSKPICNDKAPTDTTIPRTPTS